MRKIIDANYEETLKQVILLEEALPPSHLARFVVDIIAQLDLSEFNKQYSNQGGAIVCAAGFAGVVVLWLCHGGI